MILSNNKLIDPGIDCRDQYVLSIYDKDGFEHIVSSKFDFNITIKSVEIKQIIGNNKHYQINIFGE